jgi:hypothetical protein
MHHRLGVVLPPVEQAVPPRQTVEGQLERQQTRGRHRSQRGRQHLQWRQRTIDLQIKEVEAEVTPSDPVPEPPGRELPTPVATRGHVEDLGLRIQ